MNRMILGPTCHSGGIVGRGFSDPEGKQVMLLGISPGTTEMQTGVPMSGKSGKLIDGLLKACGWHRDRVYVTNLVCSQCQEPTLEQVLACKPRLEREIREIKPKLVILLGQFVAKQYFGDRPFNSAGGNGVRGILDWYAPWNCYIMPTYHPAALLYGDAAKYVQNDIARDFAKIKEFFDAPPTMASPIQFYTVDDVRQAQHVLDNLPRGTYPNGTPKFVALDIETPFKDDDETAAIEDPITCFSISDGERTWWFPGEFAGQVRWPLDVEWTFHNGAYDTINIAQRTGVMLPIKHDTMYMSAAKDERGGVHGLKGNLRETEGVGFYEEAWGRGAQAVTARAGGPTTGKKRTITVTSRWDARVKADPAGFKLYNATDALGTARLAARYYRHIQDANDTDHTLDLYNNLLIPAVNAYRRMQQHGVMVSWERVAVLRDTWIPLGNQKADDLERMAYEAGGPEHINPNSPKQLSKFLYGTLRLPGGPSTARDVLETLAGEHPFVDALLDYRHLAKAVNTYVAGLWPAVKKSTMRVHPWAKLHGTVSGRVAYFNPAINTTPRAYSPNPYLSKLKYLFVAPPGKVLIELDYKQAECWVAYMYCRDAQLLADLKSGDLHRQTAAFINKVAPRDVTPFMRAKAKNTTFGMFYGIGAEKLGKQNNMSREEAQIYIDEWRERYPEYPKYAKQTLQDAWTKGAVSTITGRLRRYPCSGVLRDTGITNEAKNFPIQATSHDYLMASIIEGQPYVEQLGAEIILDVHDACLVEANESNWQEVAQVMVEIMQKPRFGVEISLPVEVKVGTSWATVEEVDLSHGRPGAQEAQAAPGASDAHARLVTSTR